MAVHAKYQVLGADENSVRKAISILTCSIHLVRIPLTPFQHSLLGAPKYPAWQELFKSSEQYNVVRVEIQEECIVVEGVAEHVSETENQIRQFLEAPWSSSVDDQVSVETEAELKYMKKYRNDYWSVC